MKRHFGILVLLVVVVGLGAGVGYRAWRVHAAPSTPKIVRLGGDSAGAERAGTPAAAGAAAATPQPNAAARSVDGQATTPGAAPTAGAQRTAPAVGDAAGQQGQRVAGTIGTIDGKTLNIQTREGDTTSVQVTTETVVITTAQGKLSEIKAGDSVIIAGKAGSDATKLTAANVVVTPAALQKLEGGGAPRAFAGARSGNGGGFAGGFASGVVEKADAGSIVLKDAAGITTTATVPPDAAITTMKKGAASDLKEGMTVTITVGKDSGGKLVAKVVSLGGGGMFRRGANGGVAGGTSSGASAGGR